MNCAACQHENPDGSAFCGECGARFARQCPACGSVCAPTEKFCRSCGTALASRAAAAADDVVARKVITIVFADLIGSTALHERLDPESVSRVMERYHSAVRGPVEAHGGTVVHLLGDGVMCAFGVPHVAEDDAIRAVRAAVDIQHAFREFAREHREVVGTTGLRVAVNTGEVVVSDNYAAGIGDPLNVAARLQQEAHDGDVLIGQSTQRLVRDVVTLEPFGVLSLKGRAETVTAYRVVSLERPAGASTTPFVGRDDEVRRIMAVYDAAVAARRARLAVILGAPGLGKTRLVDEVARRLGENVTVLRAQCDATAGATFAPIAKALRMGLRIDEGASGDALRAAIDAVALGDEAERPRIAAGIASLLAGAPASPEETFFVIRRQLAALAATQPVVLIIDDLHWAEPLLLDLTEHLVQWSTDVPLLVLAAARPELRETRSSLTSPGGLVSDVVTLAGLEATAATRLAANVIGAEELPAAIAGRVLAASEGNPLFVGELVRMLVQDGALKREGDRWTTAVELADLEMPPTIQALLAARIERLRPEERIVLERAAVVGRQFSRAALTHLLPREITDLDTRLEALRRSELVEPDVGWFLGEPALRFHHVLIRDAAYRRILKGTRAELHERLAGWLERRAGEAVEHDETIGWHLEQAHQHLRELGPIDEKGRRLGERASMHLAAAGRRALARDDVPLAASLLGRAIERLDAEDTARAELALDWCEALLAAGDVGPAAKAIEELARFIEDGGLGAGGWGLAGTEGSAQPAVRSQALSPTSPQSPAPSPREGGQSRLRAWHTCFTGQLAVLTDPQALRITANAVAAAADELSAAGDAPGEAKAHSVHALALARLGEVGACEAALDRALAAARRGRDRRRANAVLAEAPLAALWGPSPVTRASGRCLDVVRVLRITQGAPGVEAVALRCQAVLEALRGRGEAARRMVASSRHMVEELGITQGLLETEMFAGLIELIEGDTAAAEHSLRAAYEGLRTHGLGIDAARAAALLGRTLLAQGRPAEAETLSHESEALAGDDLQAAITWRRVRAEALARRGEHAAAVDFARAAVTIAAATDALLHHADARLALATALRAADRSTEAAAEQARAIELWEAKGAAVLAERARRGVALAQPVQPTPVERDERARPAPRRVRGNTATAHVTRLSAAIAARDWDALTTLIADEMEVVHHPTHSVYDGRELLRTWRAVIEARDGTLTFEVLATLGESFALCRQWISASGAAGKKFDIGAYEIETIALVEVDEQGRRRRSEVFAADRLGDAIGRLYERYADLLPEGPERARAAATARSVAAAGPAEDFGSWAATLAPAIQFVDQRGVGFGSVRGAEAVCRSIRAMLELAENWSQRFDDILALRPDAFLVRWTNSGTMRAGGGAYERPLLQLRIFGPDGRVTYMEQFDAEQDAEALARFDEITGEIEATSLPLARPTRRVRANAAIANAARFEAAIAARDFDAVAAHLADGSEVMDHNIHTIFERQGSFATWRSLMSAEDGTYRLDPLATLGDSLALCRQWASASGIATEKLDVGAYEIENIILVEVDAQGRRRRTEVFAANRLGDAVVRLYERYAELLPAGGARSRAAATARTVTALLGPLVPEVWEAALAPDVEYVDHRTLGLGSTRGAQRFLQGLRSLLEVGADVGGRVDDILGLRPDALLMRRTNFGTVRASGGAFERPHCRLVVFGIDGLLTRNELFDPDRDAEALARFDELTAEIEATPLPPAQPARRVRPNAATALAARLDAVVAARDADALPMLLAEDDEVVEHTTGATYGRSGSLSQLRRQLRARGLTRRTEPLATLGDSLAVCRMSVSGTGAGGRTFDVGAFDSDYVCLFEVDAHGRRRRSEVYAADHLGDAVVRLYERHAELLPEGPARARAAATARALGAYVGPLSIERSAAAFALDVELDDHRTMGLSAVRGKDALLDALRSLLEVAVDAANRIDDVLCQHADGLLARMTNFGVQRVGGGAYERPFLMLWMFDAAGLVKRVEQFDVGHEAEAVVRFEQLMRVAVARRWRANAATANLARANAAFAARDAAALPSLLADRVAIVDHSTGATYDRGGLLASQRFLLNAADSMYRHEPLATLGDSLVLAHSSMSASGFVGGTFDVGAYEREEIILIEVDAQGRRRMGEIFAADRLADAIARLYERYAELLADEPFAPGVGTSAAGLRSAESQAGPAHARAAATARSVAAVLDRYRDPDCYATALAPAVEFVDHQPVGLGSARGAEALLRGFRALIELTDGTSLRVDDVLGLRSDAVLIRETNFGTDRASGGAYERHHLSLCVYGADGLLSRLEWFAADREADALARFDESFDGAQDGLVLRPEPSRRAAEPPAVRPARRVRANAATTNAAGVDAAIAARDADALLPLFADDVEAVHHPTGTTYDRQGAIAYGRALLRADDVTLVHEPLATLGDSLALCRRLVSASGAAGKNFDVGAYENETVVLIEVDAQGQRRRFEVFAENRLGDAVVRLYASYADLLPDGPARARAAATARSVAAMTGPFDLDRYATAMAPSLEFVDHRSVVGIGSTRGAAAYLDWLHTLFDVADDVVTRLDDVLGLQSAVALVRRTTSGTERASGGAFERQLLQLWVFGIDGRIEREEHFDINRSADALARFDELAQPPPSPSPVRKSAHGGGKSTAEGLTAEPPAVQPARRVPANAATANTARLDAAIAARDADALAPLLADGVQIVDHPTGVVYGREGVLFSLRSVLKARDPVFRHEPLAALGDSLALFRQLLSASGAAGAKFDVGAYESERIVLIEVDTCGRRTLGEFFVPERLGDAVARLYERHADLLPEGAERARAAATARSAAALLGPPDRWPFAPDAEATDHRTVGFGSVRGGDAVLQAIRALLELSEDFHTRIDDVVGLRSDALLVRWTTSGTVRVSGGAFERNLLMLWVFGADGLLTRWEQFDADRDAEAPARLDALTGASIAPRIENAATRSLDRFGDAWRDRDWARVTALFAPDFRYVDRRRMLQLDLDRDQFFGFIRPLFDMASSRVASQVLATRGDRLALIRFHFEGADRDRGPTETESLAVTELDDHGQRIAHIRFEPDDLDAAYAELDARFDAGEGSSSGTQLKMVARDLAARDWDGLAARLTPDIVVHDHRPVGWDTLRGPQAYVEILKALVDLAPDARIRGDHVRVCERRELIFTTLLGTREGGAFEDRRIVVAEGDSLGRIRRIDFYTLDQLNEARERFAAIDQPPPGKEAEHAPQPDVARDPLRIPPNAATRVTDGLFAAFEAREWDAFGASCAAEVMWDDRRRSILLTGDRDTFIASSRWLASQAVGTSRTLLATAGDRLALEHLHFVGATDAPDGEMEIIILMEVDVEGRLIAQLIFDDRRAASLEMLERYARSDAARSIAPVFFEGLRAVNANDIDRLRALLSDDFVLIDHRRTGLGRLNGEDYLASLTALFERAPDVTLENLYTVAVEPHGILVVARNFGTLREGGDFESVYVRIGLMRDDRIVGVEMFEPEDLDLARARFAELCDEARGKAGR